jgi:cell division protein FtsN
MTNQPSALRFDHREVAVIFSLFIFVSLLMFTVGIVVGKGLAQARYDTMLANRALITPEPQAPAPAPATTVTEPERTPAQSPAEPIPTGPLKLIPKVQGPVPVDPAAAKEAESLVKNPKIRALLEGYESGGKSGGHAKAKAAAPATSATKDPRATASIPLSVPPPPSFAAGPYTVQVGSYPTKADAADRINQLKTMGFEHAYLSVKKFGDGKEIWYRVWLGYYPDMESAQKSGDYLQQRGEVNNYLIRKSDNPG